MEKPPIPADEEERLAALTEYQVLDSVAETIFDQITDIASIVCGVPISLITLIDRERQWFKSNHGMEGSMESPRDISFCAHAILDTHIMEVNDASKDNRFFDNPFVLGDPHIKFYAGVPLVTPRGFKLGTLCVIDHEPKRLTNSQKIILQRLSDIIINIFEIKKGIVGDIKQRMVAAEALALANAKLKKKLIEQKQSRQELILLSEMSNILQACMNSDEAYHVIIKFCRQLFPQTQGMLYLLHSSHNHVQRATSWGNNCNQEDILSLEECWALRRGQPHYVVDQAQDLICNHMNCYEKVPIYMCLPLMAQGEILGLLTITFNPEVSKAEITEGQRLLAIAMAEQISLAVANAKLRETLHFQSVHDPLTGLYNRRYLNDILKNEFPRLDKNHSSAAFILLDIDHFKKFNDTHGHDAGDLVLVAVADILAKEVKNKGWSCRFGGEEFITIIKDISLDESIKFAECIMTKIRKVSIKHNGSSISGITISVGIAMFPEHGNSIDNLFTAADAALYAAKESGRNKIIVAKRALIKT